MSAVARKLGIGRSTLYRKLKEYGLHQGESDQPSDKDGDERQSDAAA
jgi:transposase-like protein